MGRRPDRVLQTVTVRSCWTAGAASGAVALVLDTVEVGPIAFAVTLETIGILRQELALAEAALGRPAGNA